MYMEKENALEGSTFKEKMAKEKGKLKELSFKQKCQYIWAYYKIVFAAVILVAVLISVGVTMYKNSRINEILYIATMDSYINEDTAPFIEEFKEQIEFDEKYDQIRLDTSYISNTEGSEYGMNSTVKLSTMIAAKQMDIMLVPLDPARAYAAQGMYLDLEQVLPEELLQKVEPYLVRGSVEETGEILSFGFRVADNEKLDVSQNFYGKDIVLSIVTNTEHLDMVISFIEYLSD